MPHLIVWGSLRMYQSPLYYLSSFLMGTAGFTALDRLPRSRYTHLMRWAISLILTAFLLVVTVSWSCLMKWYWGREGKLIFADAFDMAHPMLVLALGLFSLCVCTMTFYWEGRDLNDERWPLQWIIFRAVTIMIPAFIFSNGL